MMLRQAIASSCTVGFQVIGTRSSLTMCLVVAGHGKQVLDRDGDEVDGYDEG